MTRCHSWLCLLQTKCEFTIQTLNITWGKIFFSPHCSYSLGTKRRFTSKVRSSQLTDTTYTCSSACFLTGLSNSKSENCPISWRLDKITFTTLILSSYHHTLSDVTLQHASNDFLLVQHYKTNISLTSNDSVTAIESFKKSQKAAHYNVHFL